jgi:hypothetical protein
MLNTLARQSVIRHASALLARAEAKAAADAKPQKPVRYNASALFGDNVYFTSAKEGEYKTVSVSWRPGFMATMKAQNAECNQLVINGFKNGTLTLYNAYELGVVGFFAVPFYLLGEALGRGRLFGLPHESHH